jgi:zinc/manganese transport system permease protein
MFAGFMTNTWIAATLVAVVAGAIGFFVVLRGASFLAHAIPHGGVACEFVKYPTLRVAGVSECPVAAGFVGGAGPGVVAGEVDVFPAER